ncbi:3158_t:CDS:2 [Diversispora eburnea]|uniref:3158_t:CDS:1 n=1 Tax=Diversispora eburnea TaxID=1213867 RepID=A0A9N9F9A2_9GLOM|nr:3158_t:CDS:2 [Diversispora eburnea]
MSPSVKGKVSRNYTTLACENCKKSKTRCVQSFDAMTIINSNDKETKMEIYETKMDMGEKDNKLNSNIQETGNQCNPHIISPTFTSNPNLNKNLNKNHITERPRCSRCNRRNLNCKYVPPIKKRGPKTRNSKMSVENLVTRDNVSV